MLPSIGMPFFGSFLLDNVFWICLLEVLIMCVLESQLKQRFFCFTKLRQFSVYSFITFSRLDILLFPVHNQPIILKFS